MREKVQDQVPQRPEIGCPACGTVSCTSIGQLDRCDGCGNVYDRSYRLQVRVTESDARE